MNKEYIDFSHGKIGASYYIAYLDSKGLSNRGLEIVVDSCLAAYGLEGNGTEDVIDHSYMFKHLMHYYEYIPSDNISRRTELVINLIETPYNNNGWW